MKLNIKLVFVGFTLFLSTSGCQSAANTNVAVNTVRVNTANDASNTSVNADAPAAPVAGSPTAAYIAAYNARKNKDIPALRSLMSKDIIEFFEIMGEEDKKSVDDMLKELADQPQAPTAEVRNEKINGDKATIEFLDEDGNWSPMDLVKEDGVWKLTLGLGEPQREAHSNTNK